MRWASLRRFACTRRALRRSGLLTLTLALGPFGFGCEIVLGVEDAGAPDGHVQEPVSPGPAADAALGPGSAADAALDAGLDAASSSDAMSQAPAGASAATPVSDAGEGRPDAHTSEAGLDDAGARTNDAATQDAAISASDAKTSEASANDAAASDAAAVDGGPGVPAPNATVTRFTETGRTCYRLSDGSKASQLALCQAELCGPLQVELELRGLAGGQFDVHDCTPFDPSTPLADVPITVDLSSTGGSLRVLFAGALRSLPLTIENLRAHVMWGEFTYVGAHTDQPSSAQAYFDSSERVPVEIVDYRDELLHLRMEYVHTWLWYSELNDGFPCETPPSPLPGICKELYCSYSPGSSAERAARSARLDAIGRLPARYCP
jgi:hypothetical protein